MPPSPERRFNSRLGLILFAVYLVLYLGFVLTNALQPSAMETIIVLGLNLAIVYGFALIVAAIFLALLYGLLCRKEIPNATANTDRPQEGASE
ncbi:hypothetical protein CA13_13450 [Planctomycetes bacterium CA13]|uniref:DUF485 domain-containing protein n=1 Tax=Novipirellula herctigrandis TaxID=2527986 RepID=A0A5C5YY27_9BACT|nr:hypothetical protein CA13_13450 [Planctomycetes bacterium CA13]